MLQWLLPAWDGLVRLLRHRRAFLLLLVFFLAGNTAIVFLNRPWKALEKSTWACGFESGRIARNLLSGLGYSSPFACLPGDSLDTEKPAPPGQETVSPEGHPTAWITPPNVYMWELVFFLFGVYTPASWAAFLLLQTLCMAGSAWMCRIWLREACGETAAALASAGILLYPSSWYQASSDTHSTALFLVFASLAFLACHRASRNRLGWFPVFGLSTGLAVLTEPSCVLFFFLLVLFLTAGIGPGRNLARIARFRFFLWAGLGCCLVWAPWFIRNGQVFQAPILFKSNLAMEFYYGNSDQALTDIMGAHMARFAASSRQERLLLLQEGEVAYGKRCWASSLDFVKEKPAQALRLCFNRFFHFWIHQPYKTSTNPFRPLLNILFTTILLIWAVAWARTRPAHPGAAHALILLFLATYPAIYYLTHFTLLRYRFPAEFLALQGVAIILATATDRKGVQNPSYELRSPTLQ